MRTDSPGFQTLFDESGITRQVVSIDVASFLLSPVGPEGIVFLLQYFFLDHKLSLSNTGPATFKPKRKGISSHRLDMGEHRDRNLRDMGKQGSS